jgi:hypothetical protein
MITRPIPGRTTVYRAKRLDNGKVVCVDADWLPETSKVVTEADYDLAKSLGWCDSPQEAMAQFEQEQIALGDASLERAYEDRHLSEAAQAEVQAIESTTIRHLPEIPEGPKKRGRPRKGTMVGG